MSCHDIDIPTPPPPADAIPMLLDQFDIERVIALVGAYVGRLNTQVIEAVAASADTSGKVLRPSATDIANARRVLAEHQSTYAKFTAVDLRRRTEP